MAYKQGDTVVCWTEWRVLQTSRLPIVSRVLTNPSTISCSVTAPDGSVTTPTPTSSATGVYHVSFAASQVGTYSITWTGTGAAAGVHRHTLTVEAL